MPLYAHIMDGRVFELFSPPAGIPITDCFHGGLVWADVTAVSPTPQPGWTATPAGLGWTYAPPPAPPAPTLVQQAEAMLTGTITVSSTSTPSLDGAYAVDLLAQSHINSEMLCAQVTGKFADGATTVDWLDATGVTRTFPSVAVFQAFALAVAAFVAGCFKVIAGTSTTLPSVTVTVS